MSSCVIKHGNGKSHINGGFKLGTSSINGACSISILLEPWDWGSGCVILSMGKTVFSWAKKALCVDILVF